jgi:uncharacterized protein YehS (DUF1456 family)
VASTAGFGTATALPSPALQATTPARVISKLRAAIRVKKLDMMNSFDRLGSSVSSAC